MLYIEYVKYISCIMQLVPQNGLDLYITLADSLKNTESMAPCNVNILFKTAIYHILEIVSLYV